jgi:YbbR domain-containing protein
MHLAEGLRTNVGLKILSISLALLLWSFVHGAKVVEREYAIPIHYENLADSLMFVGEPPAQMRVLLSGPAQDLLLHLRFMRDVAAHIDLSGVTVQLDRVAPSISDITAPANERVSVVRILSPSVIAFRLAVRGQRQVPVRIATQGMPEGFCLADTPRVEPPSVDCTGPQSLVTQFDGVRTLPLKLPARRGRVSQELELVYDRTRLRCTPDRVRVTLTIERLQTRELAGVPLVIVPPASAELWVAADVGTASLTLAGPEPRIESLTPEDVGLFLDASQLVPGRHDSVSVIARVPDWAQLLRVQPESVGLTVHFDSEPIQPSTHGDSAEVERDTAPPGLP